MQLIDAEFNNRFLSKLRSIQDKRLYSNNLSNDLAKWLLFDSFFDVYKHSRSNYVALIFTTFNYKLYSDGFGIEFTRKENKPKIWLPYISTEEEYFMQSTLYDFESLELSFEVMLEIHNYYNFITDFIRECNSVHRNH